MESEGHFSLGGWLDDIIAADRPPARHGAAERHLAGRVRHRRRAVASAAAARDPAIKGVAALGAPADFDDWASQPRRLLEHARAIGLIRDPAFPPALDRWSRELRDDPGRPVHGAVVAPRPVLVVHGTDDESVPAFDARVAGRRPRRRPSCA